MAFSLRRGVAGLVAGVAMACASPALADKIKNPTAVFSGLDKITGRIISFEAGVDETVQFGALQLTARVCYSRPPTEAPNTTAFVEVDEVTFTNEHRRIFGGWMYASSPGLHGIEHAVYDLWLTECKGGTEVIAEAKEIDPADEALKRDAAQDARRQQRRPPDAPGQAQRREAGQQPRQRFFPQDERQAVQQPQQQQPQRQQPQRQRNFFEMLFGQ